MFKFKINSFRRCDYAFTIVELLVVIVVIGILAAITIVAYSGIQDRSRTAKMRSDIASLNQAIVLARNQTGTVLGAITGSFSSAAACIIKASGTDLAALPHDTDGCWVTYASTLNLISNAAGVNIRNLVDPYGRPYFIDENENEGGPSNCAKDTIGAFQQPFVTGWARMVGTEVDVVNSARGC